MEEGCAVVVSLISPANFLWVSLWWRYAAAPLQSVVVAPLGKVRRTHTHTHTHTHTYARRTTLTHGSWTCTVAPLLQYLKIPGEASLESP